MNALTLGFWLFGLSSLVLFVVSVLPHNKRVRLLTFVAWTIMSCLTLLYYIVWELTGSGFNQSIPYHFRFGMEGTGISDFYQLIAITGVVLLLLSACFYCFRRFIVKDHHTSHYYYSSLAFLAVLFAFHPLWSEIYDTYKEQEISPIPFEEHYATPVLTGGNPATYPNLVWIYAESFERTYLNESLFPGLTPELTKLEQQSLSCTDVRQVYGTGWTIAGIVSSQCGIPLVTMGLNGNELDRMQQFLPGAKGMGDLLSEKKYTLEFMMGASGSFAGTTKYLHTHGFQLIDLDVIQPQHPEYPIEGWGITDDLLFDLAKDRYAELHKKKQPFAIMISTIDTHHPYGRVPPTCLKQYGDGKNWSLNAIHASDAVIATFVRRIREMDTAKNTLIVITSDHLSLPNTAWDQLGSGERRNLLMYNWPGKIQPGKIDRPACSFDKGITALHLMGFDSKALGLGRSLLGEEKTFVEKFSDPDRQLKGWECRMYDFWR